MAALSTPNGANHIHARVTRNPLLAKSGPPFVEIFENFFLEMLSITQNLSDVILFNVQVDNALKEKKIQS